MSDEHEHDYTLPTGERIYRGPLLPEWFDEWTEARRAIAQDGIDWMRSRPESVKATMRRFPPSCVVLTSHGCFGILASVFENGDVSIRPSPATLSRFRAKAEGLKVVGYWNGLTPERVAKILDGEAA